MATTNDQLKQKLEELFPGSEVVVEGDGARLSPFKVTKKGEGGTKVVHTSMSFDDLAQALK